MLIVLNFDNWLEREDERDCPALCRRKGGGTRFRVVVSRFNGTIGRSSLSSGGAVTMGDEGTGGNPPSADGCLLFILSLNAKREANPNVDLVGGADGGGRSVGRSPSVNDRCLAKNSGLAVGGGGTSSRNVDPLLSFFQSGDEELLASEDSVVSPLGLLIERLGASNPPPTPSSSASSLSSIRFSSRMLPEVTLLLIEPARYRLFHAEPMPIPVDDPIEEPEALRETTRSSIALSKACASLM